MYHQASKQHSKSPSNWLGLLLLVIAFQSPILAQSRRGSSDNPPDLLIPAKKAAQEIAVIRSRTASINPDVVNKLNVNGLKSLSFNLFDDARFTGIIDRYATPSHDSVAWSGSIQEAVGSFTLLVYNNKLFANIHVPDKGVFEIRPGEGDTSIVRQIDPTKLLECGVSKQNKMATFTQVTAVCDSDPVLNPSAVIELLVIYTAAARVGAGGKDAVEGLIRLNIDETNQTFAKSGVNAQANLAHVTEISYTETGVMETDLARLTGKTDGFLDDVHNLRNTHRADTVSLIVESANHGGYAHEMGTLNPSFERFAFGVVHRLSSSGNYAFTHELGHNLGASHDVDNGGPGLCSYSNGWRWTYKGLTYKSMMAYRPGVRSLHFSNPKVRFNGDGPLTGNTTTADNARTLRISLPTVAGFR